MRLNLSNIVVLLLIFVSCEDVIDLKLPPMKQDVYVVSGLITNELDFVTVSVTQISKHTGVNVPVSHAIVFIESESMGNGEGVMQRIDFVEDSLNPGMYVSDRRVRAVINRNYTLNVHIDTMHITATAYMEPITNMLPVSYYKVASEEGIFALSDEQWSEEQAMWKFSLNWDFNHTCDTCKAQMFAYSLQSVDVAQLLSPKKQKVVFPLSTQIIREKYSLTKEHAEYVRGLLLETQWNGGYFDEQPANVSSNFSHGVLGYWGACMVLRDTTVVQ